ncbi:MAG: MFS transporter permease [Gemmatimonadales bacterium]|nr:MFS transporter permease [Gemmatimonadales bacterium]
MDEWWTYTLSDLLLFSPRTYYRMLQRHNETLWPGQILTLGLGLGIMGLLRRPAAWQGRAISTIVATLWAWVAWSFLARRHAAINWAASYFAWLFAAELLLLVWIGGIRGRLRYRPSRSIAGVLGFGLFALALAFYPLIAPLSGRPWQQSEVFGIFPDPTAIATVGLLLLAEGSQRWGLLIVPLLWCFISGATLWALGSTAASA